MLHGTVKYGLKAGGESGLDWAAYARLIKEEGKVKMEFYQVYLVSCGSQKMLKRCDVLTMHRTLVLRLSKGRAKDINIKSGICRSIFIKPVLPTLRQSISYHELSAIVSCHFCATVNLHWILLLYQTNGVGHVAAPHLHPNTTRNEATSVFCARDFLT